MECRKKSGILQVFLPLQHWSNLYHHYLGTATEKWPRNGSPADATFTARELSQSLLDFQRDFSPWLAVYLAFVLADILERPLHTWKKNGRYVSYSMHFLSEWWEKTRALAQVFLNIFEKIVKYTKLACVNWRSYLKIYMGIKVREVVECKMELETCENGVDYYYCSNGSFSHHYFLHFISLHM